MYSEIINALETEDDDSSSDKSFYTTGELSPEDFYVEVKTIGKISFPLDHTILQKLSEVSSEAKFGLREKTLLDKKFRDTSEISAENLKVKCNEKAFSNLLNKMRDGLGLSENAELTAHLHNLLVYGPGQFFKPHQDSEKLEGMIGTLVVSLPCPHIGGDLIVNHNQKKYRFVTENIDSTKLQCLAFYADCQHEVEKVKQGNRVVLTYNLVLKNSEIQPLKHENIELEKALKEYFSGHGDMSDQPLTLVYFLNHSYTEHSLRWNVLKGADHQNALDFRSAAKKLGLIPHLTLVELHESWAAYGDEDDPEPEELIDNSTALSYWLDENDKELPYGEFSISDDAACWTKDTEEFEPSDTEYEGYMGNYGNTVDYWYRRAAVVLWLKSDQIIMSFKLNYESALEELEKLTHQAGQEKKVLDILQKVKNYLYQDITPNVFKFFANLALYIKDQDVAKFILSKFSLNIFDHSGAKDFVKLQELYGVLWGLELINHWLHENTSYHYRYSNKIEKPFDQFIMQLQGLHADFKLISYLLQHQINYTITSDKGHMNSSPVEIRKYLKERILRLTCLLKACDHHRETSLTEKLVQHILSNSLLYPEDVLATMILEAEMSTGYLLLKDTILKRINEELERGLRDPQDTSIEALWKCTCDLCKTAQSFLSSKTEKTKIWPIVAHDREHVMDIFKRLGVSVDLSVKKEGSPHKLVMVKSDKLYDMAKDRFNKLTVQYEKLKGINAFKNASEPDSATPF